MKTEEGVPDGLGEAGAALWASVVADYELELHEERLLLEVCRTADLCERLAVEAAGPLTTAKGAIAPAVVELRHERIVLARLLAALRVPLGAEVANPNAAPRLQRRSGARGIYGLSGAS